MRTGPPRITCRQEKVAGVGSNNVQVLNLESFVYKRPDANEACMTTGGSMAPSKEPPVTPTAFPRLGASLSSSLVPLSDSRGRMTHLHVPLHLPPAPHFLHVPKWDPGSSTGTSVAIQGALDSPGLIYYAVRASLILRYVIVREKQIPYVAQRIRLFLSSSHVQSGGQVDSFVSCRLGTAAQALELRNAPLVT
jgi:hypothetical protein